MVAKTDFKSVDDYIASQPDAAQAILGLVRRAIREGIPGADEVISYKIPAYKVDGRAVLYFAGWKEHFSILPCRRFPDHSVQGRVSVIQGR